MNKRRENQIALGIAILTATVFLLSGTLVTVIPAGQAGVVFNLFGGVEKRTLKEGINFIIPFIETVTAYDLRKVSYNFTDNYGYESNIIGQSIKCQTNDGQQVDIDVTVIAHPDSKGIWRLHQNLGRDYVDKLITPQTRSVFRNIVAKYPIDTVYTTSRNALAKDAESALRKSFSKNNVYLDELLIRAIAFSPAFAEAVERKQIALQESQRQNWMKKTAEREKERRVIEGEGDAKALSVKGQALKLDPRISELEFLEQLEQRETDIPVITGAKNAILSIGDIFNDESLKQPINSNMSSK